MVELLTRGNPGQELYTEGLELITVHSNVSNTSFQDFISAITIEDLYLQQPLANANANATANATIEIDPQIKLSNTTAGRQLLNSIEKEHSIIHSLLETENTLISLNLNLIFNSRCIISLTSWISNTFKILLYLR